MSLTKVTYSMIDGAVLNVLDYNAKGDGIADDTAAIQAAIDAISVDGGTVYLPAGVYMTTGINLNSNVQLLGESRGSVILKLIDGTDAPVISCLGTQALRKFYVSIKSLTIDGNTPIGSVSPTTNKHGIFFGYVNFATFDDLFIYGCGHNGIKCAGVNQSSLRNSEIASNWIGVYWSGYFTGSTVIECEHNSTINCVIRGNANDGIDFDFGTTYSTIVDCFVYNNDIDNDQDGGNIVVASDNALFPCKYIGVFNNRLYGGSLSFSGTQNFECIGNFVYDAGRNTTPSTPQWGHGIEVFTKAGQAVCFGGRIVGNTVLDSGKHGIAVIDFTNSVTAYNITICDNEITNSGKDQDNTYSGVYLTRCTNVNVSNNIITSGIVNRTKYQIETTDTVTQALCMNNIVSGGTTANYSLNAVGTVICSDNQNNQYNVRSNQRDTGINITGSERPRLSLDPEGITSVTRMYARDNSFYSGGIWNNLQWAGSGANYNLDDTSLSGWDIYTDVDVINAVGIRRASPGANPRTLLEHWRVAGALPSSGETVMWLLVNDGASTTLRQVQVGGIDSGGTGYRLLRVTN